MLTQKYFTRNKSKGGLSAGKRSKANYKESISSSSENDCHILRLPTRVRSEIWKRVGVKDLLHLRLTCFKINYDVTHRIGLNIVIEDDEDEEEQMNWYEHIGIRNVEIISLSKELPQDFLAHPNLLTEFSITGVISHKNFYYFMHNCHNIVKLTIEMQKALLRSGRIYFPITSNINRFENLKEIKYTGCARSQKELECLKTNLSQLLERTINHVHLTSINISICNKFKSRMMRDCHQIVSAFVLKNLRWLKSLHISIRENYFGITPEQLYQDKFHIFPLPSMEVHNIENKETLSTKRKNRDDRNLSVTLTNPNILSPFASDDKHASTDSDLDADEDISCVNWKPFPHLTKVHLIINGNCFHVWKECFSIAMVNVKILFLDLYTSKSNWNLYCESLWNNRLTLTTIMLVDVVCVDNKGKCVDLDLNIFNHCRKLQRLSIVGKKHETVSLSKLLNVSKLPNSLQTFDVSYFIVTSWQLFRLLCCFKKLENLAVSYGSYSNEQFSKFLSIFRFLTILKLTPLKNFVLIDTKIRFQNHTTKIADMTKTFKSNLVYVDFKESKLTVRPKSNNNIKTNFYYNNRVSSMNLP